MTETPAEETVYYRDQDATVTNARAIIKGKTYAMSQITSVALVTISKAGMVVLGSLTAVIGLLATLAGIGFNAGAFAIILGLALLGGGAAMVYAGRTQYAVQITSSSGEVNALVSNEKERLQKIVDALNEAIIKRG